MAASFSIGSFAETGPSGVPEGFTAERYALVSDGTVEWDEISDRIICFNPTYTMYHDYAMGTVNDMKGAFDDFTRGMMEQIDSLDTVEDELLAAERAIIGSSAAGTPEGIEQYEQIEEQLKEARDGRQQLRSAVTSAAISRRKLNGSADHQLSSLKVQLTNVVEGLIISYKQLEINRELLAGQVELYRELCGMKTRMMEQGLATAYDVSSARQQLNEAEKTLADLDSGLGQLKSAIGQQLGFPDGGSFVLAELPAPDQEYIRSVDPAADRETAYRANSEITAAMKPADGSQSAADFRDGNVNILRGKLDSRMDSLYNDMKAKSYLYEAAGTSGELARRSYDSAKRLYGLGMAGQSEYLGAGLQALSYKMAADSSELELFKAVNDYRWALRGVVDLG